MILEGNNTITVTGNTGNGIFCTGGLNFWGSGNLTITSEKVDGIGAGAGALRFEGSGTIDITANHIAISGGAAAASNSINISGGTIKARGGENSGSGIYITNGMIEITDGDVYASGRNAAIYASVVNSDPKRAGISITGGTVVAEGTGTEGHSILAGHTATTNQECIIAIGETADVTATSAGNAIWAFDGLTLGGSCKVVATASGAGQPAIRSKNADITVSGAAEITASSKIAAFYADAGSISFDDSVTVNATADTAGIYAKTGDVTITGGSVATHGTTNGFGIKAGGTITQSDGGLVAKGAQMGISSTTVLVTGETAKVSSHATVDGSGAATEFTSNTGTDYTAICNAAYPYVMVSFAITPTVAVSGSYSYTYGNSLSDYPLTGTVKDGETDVAGVLAWNTDAPIPAVGDMTAPWTFTPTDTDTYESVSGTQAISVSKATPSGTPTFTAINADGKTLADADLAGSFANPYSAAAVPGVLTWDEATTTQITRNTEYNWTFMPTDSVNYNNATGKIKLWSYSAPTTGGGTATKPPVIEALPDGTVIKTQFTTKTDTSTGAKVEQKTVTTTKPDGTVTKEETIAVSGGRDGVTASVTMETNAAGETTVTAVVTAKEGATRVKLPAAVVKATTGDSIADVSVGVSVGGVALTFDAKSWEALKKNAATPTISVTPADPKTLPEAIRDTATAYNFTMGGKGVDFNGGTVTVSIAYEKKDGTKAVAVYFVAGDATMTRVVAMRYQNGTVSFPQTHWSTYAIVEETALPFTDVAEGDWHYESVRYTFGHELLKGVNATTFAPDAFMTRSMLWTTLARLDGQDTTVGATWDEAGMRWATEKGISDGTSPEVNVTREQLVAMLYRYVGSPAAPNLVLDFTDADKVSDWAVDALRWAVDEGIIAGKGGDILDPKGAVTRAEVAAVLYHYLENTTTECGTQECFFSLREGAVL